MYLEISPRKSGKTNRLVSAVCDALDNLPPHFNAVILTPLRPQSLTGMFPSEYRPRLFIETNIEKVPPMAARYFFDDFDFLPAVRYRQDGYYTTSVRKNRSLHDIETWLFGERSDWLLSLLAINNNQAASYPPKKNQGLYSRAAGSAFFEEPDFFNGPDGQDGQEFPMELLVNQAPPAPFPIVATNFAAPVEIGEDEDEDEDHGNHI